MTIFRLFTLQSHDTANHDDVASSPPLHVGHHFLDHADHPEEVGLKHLLHLVHGDALQRTHQSDACVVDCGRVIVHRDHRVMGGCFWGSNERERERDSVCVRERDLPQLFEGSGFKPQHLQFVPVCSLQQDV